MAFGRSNSLSINTGASNSLFGNNTTTSQPPPPAGGLFGRVGTSQPAATGGSSLFGNAASNPTSTAGGTGLFGNTTSSNAQSNTGGTSLFGNTQQNAQQKTGGTSLFGNTQQNAQQNTGGTGLFGNNASTTQQNTGGTSLFGNTNSNQQNTGSASLFGNTNSNQQNTGATSLFGAPLNQSTQQQSGGTGLFGSSTANRPTGGLFGSTTTNNNSNPSNTAGSSLFGSFNPNANQPQQPSSTTFLNMTAHPPGTDQPVSLLNSSQHRLNQHSTFRGRLTLGQNTSPNNPTNSTSQPNPAQPSTAPGAVQVHYDTMKSTTRFADLIPDVQQTLEKIDHMIQAQERFAREIEAFIPNHGRDIDTLAPDVELVSEKADAVETALALDAQGVDKEKHVLHNDLDTGTRLQRVVDNLRQPPQYHSRGADPGAKDLDLIGHFFRPLAGDMEKTLAVYADAIKEVEGHMGILEQTAVAQQLGGGGRGVGTVQELAETLGAFEEGILGAAGLVGGCREQVNGLVLGGRFGG